MDVEGILMQDGWERELGLDERILELCNCKYLVEISNFKVAEIISLSILLYRYLTLNPYF